MAKTFSNDYLKLLTHESIIGKTAFFGLALWMRLWFYNASFVSRLGIGEKIRQHYDELAEHNKQRAIRSTEEVVRREEKAKRDEEFAKATEEWTQEKECLIRQAAEDEKQAIEKAKESQEKTLRAEFEMFLATVRQQHDEDSRRRVEETWKRAEQMREAAVVTTREEERLEAERKARIVADTVRQQREDLIARTEKEKKQALAQQERELDYKYQQEMDTLTSELQEGFDKKLANVCEQYDSEIIATQILLNDKCSENVQLNKELNDMTCQKDDWMTKYDNLRQEYSAFIDQFPGFRGEFLLKWFAAYIVFYYLNNDIISDEVQTKCSAA